MNTKNTESMLAGLVDATVIAISVRTHVRSHLSREKEQLVHPSECAAGYPSICSH